jgi:hypothetical protein
VEAYDGGGAARAAEWAGAPEGYVAGDVTPGDYPITWRAKGLSNVDKTIHAIVVAGEPPVLTVATPDEVAHNGVYDAARYMSGVSATDPDGDSKGTPNPSDDIATDITSAVKYGSLVSGTFTENDPVMTSRPGIHRAEYRVFDADNNRADASRLVVVNDGGYVVGKGNILSARSFVTRLADVVSGASDIKGEILSKSKAVAINGATGDTMNLGNDAVRDVAGYRDAVGTYRGITIVASDSPSGEISKKITGKVVNAEVIEEGPRTPSQENTDRYYVYGNNISLTTLEAQRILSSADKERALLDALGARSDKVTGAGTISDADAVIESYGGLRAASAVYLIRVADACGNARAELTVTVMNEDAPAVVAPPVVDDVPKPPQVTVTPTPPNVIINNVITPTPAPAPSRVVVKNVPAPAARPGRVIINNVAAPAPAPPLVPPGVDLPAPADPVAAPENTTTPITPTQAPTSSPASGDGWHLVDLLLVIFTVALGFYLMVFAIRRRDEYDDASMARGRQIRMWGRLGVLLGITSIVALLITQTFSGDMKIIDVWAALFVVVLGVETLAVIGVRSVRSREWEEERKV